MKINSVINKLKKYYTLKANVDGLSNLINEKIKESQPIEAEVGYICLANTVMIIPKTASFKSLIENNFEVDPSDIKKAPKLDYRLNEQEHLENKEICSIYSVDLLDIAFKMMKGYDSVKIKIKPNYPITLESHEWILIIAPRIPSEDENL